MGKYSIKELERLSSIKAHTLRIWEKRYNLFEPLRTETNIRKYSDEDLKKLLKVSTLTKSGYKISKIVALDEGELTKLVAEIEDEFLIKQKRIDDLIYPMIDFDEKGFDKLFDKYVKELGLENTIIKVIYPFLEKIGLLWLTDEIDPTQEHFISHIIRQKLFVAIEKLPRVDDDAERVLLFLPEGEYHELGLLFLSFLYKERGYMVYYFGQSIPIELVKRATKKISPNYIVTYSIIRPKKGFQRLINTLSECTAKDIYFIAGSKVFDNQLNFPVNVKKIESYKELFGESDS